MQAKNKPKILITGANGFVGSRLTDELRRSHDIVCLDRDSKSSNSVKFDLQSEPDKVTIDAVGEIDQTIHLAALTPKAKADLSLDRADDFYRNNIISTLNFLKIIRTKNIKQLIYISTLDVYGSNITGKEVTELTETSPSTHYAVSKLASEWLCQVFCQDNKIPFAILRLGHVYGPGEGAYKKVIPEFIRRALTGDQLEIWGDGSAARNFINIKDITSAIAHIVKQRLDGIFNLVGSDQITILELAKLINSLAGGQSKIKFLQPGFTQISYNFSNKKLLSTGFIPKVPIKKGLLEEINYMRKNHEDLF